MRVTEHRASPLRNARLLPGDFAERVAQHLGVLQAQRRDGGGGCVAHDIGAIVLAADAHLEDGTVDAFAAEHVHGHHGEKLKVERHVGRMILATTAKRG